MAEFALKNNFFEFNNQIKQQIFGTAIGTKCAPTYAGIFMDKVETEFLETQTDKLFWSVRYIDDIFFIWTHGKEKLKIFLEDLNKFHTKQLIVFSQSLRVSRICCQAEDFRKHTTEMRS